jgi:hypothetical protein
MSIYNLSNYLAILGKMPDYECIFVKAKQLIEVQKAFLNAIPPQLKDRCAVGRYAEGILLIYASNGTAAARLRNLVPTILQELNRTEFKINNIKISVQLPISPGETRNSPKNIPRLSQTATDHINQLTAELPAESPLKSSLEALLVHANNR